MSYFLPDLSISQIFDSELKKKKIALTSNFLQHPSITTSTSACKLAI